jgi:probable F420-dependent oxidoreductase
MNYGLWMSRARPAQFPTLTVAAEEVGFSSVWMSEHIVLPTAMTGSPLPGEDHPPVPPSLPLFDTCAYLAYLAGLTSTIRLGTWVYLLAYRHPLFAARSIATLDIVSGGRVDVGIGAGWLREEADALGIDWPSRGRRLDEAVEVCRLLWSERAPDWHGAFFDFPTVMFEPKPVQQPGPPILVGGESPAALRRAAGLGDGWIGMAHTPASIRPVLDDLGERCREAGRSVDDLQIVVGCPTTDGFDPDAWEAAGVDCVIVAPWSRPSEALDGLRRFAEDHIK